MSKRVLLGGIHHETNTFLPGSTTLEHFDSMRGEAIWNVAGNASPLGGVLDVAHEHGWEVVPVIDLRAIPSATVADEVVELFFDEFRAAAERQATRGVDGIFLDLHGAMVSRSFPDVEGELLRRLRSLPGLADVPLCGVVDLHGNFTQAMARNSTGLIAYRENPHADAREAAVDAALLLHRLMHTGECTVTVWKHPPLLWPPSGTGTAVAPMRSLEGRAREIERTHPEIVAVNVFGGFSFADVPDAGVSFSAVTTGDPAQAAKLLDELSTLAWKQREAGNPIRMPLPEAVERLKRHHEGPVVLVEPADNIGAGAPGDNTFILRAFVEHNIQNAGVAINDPQAVQVVWERRVGENVELAIGGKSGVVGAEPVTLEVELLSRSDGRFTLEDRQSHLAAHAGEHIDMGPCAVVSHKSVYILLTSRPTPPFDLGQWRSQGINPEELFAIGVKAAVGHRRAYGPIAKASYTVDTPGPCAENLRRLPFQRVRRPIYPLDDDIPCSERVTHGIA